MAAAYLIAFQSMTDPAAGRVASVGARAGTGAPQNLDPRGS